MIYIPTQYHIKTVVLRIQDDKGVTRGFFLPEMYAEKMRTTFNEPEEFSCFNMFLKLISFKDTENKKVPILEILYNGSAQLPF